VRHVKARPIVIVLAAGRGIRFKGSTHKLAQPFGATSVLGTTLRHAIESQMPVLVVTTDALAAEASRWVASRDIVRLPAAHGGDARSGMGASIAAGVAARADAPGWLVLPADMPLVRPDTLKAVAAALAEHPIAFAQHQGRRGHPVAFSSELYSELSALSGDDGAKRVLARFPSHAVEVDDAGVLIDIDTEEDLHALAASLGRPGADRAKPAG
jgi:molybdenum cofactor cytidylyltransferase